MLSSKQRIVILLAFVLGAAGCVRRDGLNSDCRWPGETFHDPLSARHLSADAEFAEDLAIRYADVHFGRHSPNPSENYPVERDQCMARLFGEIAKEHGVPVMQVSASLGKNRAHIDLAELLPFALLYGLAAVLAARTIWRHYAPAEVGWASGIIMALFVSLAFAASSTLLGEVWNWILEGHRIGNSHMSYLSRGSIVLGKAPAPAFCCSVADLLAGGNQRGAQRALAALQQMKHPERMMYLLATPGRFPLCFEQH